jgi:hypothetical protein
MTRSLPLALTVAALTVASGAASASAAPVLAIGLKCVPYFGAQSAGEQYIPIGGAGWLPAVPIDLAYTTGDDGGSGAPGADGRFVTKVLAPTDFIQLTRHLKGYTLRGTQGTAKASVKFTMVRVDVVLPTRASPHAVVNYKLYGFPPGKNIYAHYIFGGKRRVRTYLGQASKACGNLSKRQQYLPARTRYGIWTVYYTAGKTLKANRKNAYWVYKFTVRRVIRFRRTLGGHAAGALPAVAEPVQQRAG